MRRDSKGAILSVTIRVYTSFICNFCIIHTRINSLRLYLSQKPRACAKDGSPTRTLKRNLQQDHKYDVPLLIHKFEEGCERWVERRPIIGDDTSLLRQGRQHRVPHHPPGLCQNVINMKLCSGRVADLLSCTGSKYLQDPCRRTKYALSCHSITHPGGFTSLTTSK